MKSIIQTEKECYKCGSTWKLHEHHCFGGTANRKLSEKYGLKIYLCYKHHEGTYGVHGMYGAELAQEIHELGQRAFEEHYPSLDFRSIFGKNYL